MAHCRSCNTSYDPFISFGKMPIANGFLTPEQFPDEYFFELAAGFCTQCKMVQLLEQPEREQMFNEHYAFYSSTSKHMAQHFAEFAAGVRHTYLTDADPLVAEIGSNDGIMLQNFARDNIRHIGIEPSANVAKVAQERGIKTIVKFFDEAIADEIIEQHGQADAFLGANVICHIPYLHSVAAGVAKLLKPKGVMVFEEPYLGDIVEKTSYDQIYDEHVFFFSVMSIAALFGQHNLEVIDVEPQWVHGGSMRYTLARHSARPKSPRVAAQLTREQELGLDKIETFVELRRKIERSREDLLALLYRLKQEGKRVVGYGATSKSTTITNYCGITPDLVEFISDTTPIKQDKYSPGVHIPVRSHQTFTQHYPDYALLFGWNHAREIREKEKAYETAGGKWILHVPQVQVIP